MTGPQTNPFLVAGSMKGIPLSALPEEAWRTIFGPDSDIDDLRNFTKRVPWLSRGLNARAQAVSSVPFRIYSGEDEIDSSDGYRNALGWLPDPFELLQLVEGSLVLHGRAYLHKVSNIARRPLQVRWLFPPTIQIRSDPERGIFRFDRSLKGQQIPLEPKDVVFIPLPNYWAEVGYGDPPAQAALAAAGVLLNLDEFAAAYFKRGAIKATLLTAEDLPSEPERRRLLSWWRRVVSGIRNAFGTDVISGKVKPVVIGEGLGDLADEGLTKAKREDISTALGIPQSILFSTGGINRAIAQQDDLHFFNKTIIPQAKLIETKLNGQLFASLGLRLEFDPQELPIFQADEEDRSLALANLVQAGEQLDNAYEILGYDLPEDVEAFSLARRQKAISRLERPEPPPLPAGGFPAAASSSLPPELAFGKLLADLARWSRKSVKRLARGESAAVEFRSASIPGSLSAAIAARLETAKTEAQVKAVFRSLFSWGDYPGVSFPAQSGLDRIGVETGKSDNGRPAETTAGAQALHLHLPESLKATADLTQHTVTVDMTPVAEALKSILDLSQRALIAALSQKPSVIHLSPELKAVLEAPEFKGRLELPEGAIRVLAEIPDVDEETSVEAPSGRKFTVRKTRKPRRR